MDAKLKALASEYEKARKQNIQLRNALQIEKDKTKACQKEIEELKSDNKGPDNASSNQIEALRMELDQKEKLNLTRIRELEATVKKLEKENSKLKENEIEPPQTEDIGIQKNEENLGSDEKELLLQETIDGLNAKIFQIQSDHEKELEMIMRDKRIQQPEILIPKELTIIDQNDLGKPSTDNKENDLVESISTFFQSRIDELHIQLQKEIARAQYSSSESKSALSRLRRAEDERHDLIGQLRKMREDKKEVENEMETIKRSYEEQLNTMTEELAQQLANGSMGNSHVTGGSTVEEEVKKKSRFSLFSRNSS